MADYLDKNGLSHLWGMIKTYVGNAVKVTGVKGNAESSYRTGNVNLTAANVGAVATSGNETVSGNKTFTGTTTIEATSVVRNQVGQVIVANANAVIQSPIPKYIWHDVLAFNRATTPKYYTTSNGTTWTEATLDKRLFIHKEAWGKINILDSSISGSRWTWIGGDLAYCSATWLVIGVAYANPISKFDVLLETSSGSDDSATWTTLVDVTGISVNQNPIWIRTNTTSTNNIRLTITRNSESASTTTLPVTSIRWLTTRWGDQGKGSEFEYPYQWNESNTIFPITNNESDLGGTSYKWKNLFATTLNASSMGNNTNLQFPQTTGVDSGISVTNATNNLRIFFGIGSGQTNRGVWDAKLNKWILHADNSNVYLNNTVVPSSPKFTDTVTTATTTGSGNAVTAVTASNGALTVTKGTTFLTSHQDISGKADKSATVSNVAYDSTNKKITKTINGTTSDVVTASDIVNPSVSVTALPINGYTMRKLNVGGVEIDNLVRIITSETASSELKSAHPYSAETADSLFPSTTVVSQMITAAMSEAGNGDMMKAVYDTDNDGVVDNSKKWNGYGLGTATNVIYQANPLYVPSRSSSDTYFTLIELSYTPGRLKIARYDDSGYLISKTPDASDSSTKAATTAFVSTAIANAEPVITDITSEFTSSNSRIVVQHAYKYGKMIELQIGVNRSASIASNGNVDGTLTSNYLPLSTVFATSFVNAMVFSAYIAGKDGASNSSGDAKTQGEMRFRNTSTTSCSASSGTYIQFCFRYIYDDGTIN